MSFQIEHEKWMNDHLKRRKGERLDALKRGHGYGNRLFVEGFFFKPKTVPSIQFPWTS
ncbi:hypothetical protein [Paenibacillus contaminans]|uniref:hypothetical protein n=1 Tax=Paenibacillus contaminans TaxID=450362 RepID=UPI001EDCDB7E|nr:hypothetical protein [Paenibacillus contaminans]